MNKESIEEIKIDENLDTTPELTSKNSKKSKKPHSKKRKIVICIILLLILAGAGVAIWYFCFYQKPTEAPDAETTAEVVEEKEPVYSVLTGEEIDDESLNSSPTFCVQIPNGTDGARPQVGLNEAGVVFEAIAEGGITRFAAIFQNADLTAIGPIRSLRMYYLEWDIPFDCTIVHAGGETQAKQEVTKYQHLSESTTYMWRDYSGYTAPNNLFTSSDLLDKFAKKEKYTTSEVEGFARLTPEEAEEIATEVNQEEEKETSEKETKTEYKQVNKINLNFGSTSNFNVVYKYNEKTNTYPRSYASGQDHISYTCSKTSKPSPKSDCGDAKQVAPSVVIAMMVDEYTKSDTKHHQSIQTIGSGKAYIFQNGTVIKGTWSKSSRDSQIIFEDSDGNEVKLTPGQTWISAIPNSYGSVKY